MLYLEEDQIETCHPQHTFLHAFYSSAENLTLQNNV